MTRAGPPTSPPAQDAQAPRLSVTIATKDRHDDLSRCLGSLKWIAHLQPEVLVIDDGSAEPAQQHWRAQRVQRSGGVPPVRFIRHEAPHGLIATRNELGDLARGRYMFAMDDDAYLLDARGIEDALAVMDADPKVGDVAMTQLDADGKPNDLQPARVERPSRVQSFIGCGHLLRRAAFLAAGGYHDVLHYYGEERELTKRMLAVGFGVVYLPEARVAHLANPAGRNRAKIVGHMWRAGCYTTVMNDPWPVVIVSVPARLVDFVRYRRKVRDLLDAQEVRRWGVRWLVACLVRDLPRLLSDRKALPKWVRKRWNELATPQPYDVPH